MGEDQSKGSAKLQALRFKVIGANLTNIQELLWKLRPVAPAPLDTAVMEKKTTLKNGEEVNKSKVGSISTKTINQVEEC